MNIRLLITFILVFLSLPSAFAKKKNTPLPPAPHAATTDTNYVPALAAANRFLQAWQMEDHEAGLLLLTDAAKHQTSEDQLEKLFDPEGTVPRGYQIVHGKKLSDRRYAFPITLYEATSTRKSPHVRNSQIIVVQTSKDDWAVDKLP